MTASTLYSIPMVKPNNVILQRFDNVLSPLFQKLEQAQLENEDLVKQRDELLPLLMNGQVEVKQLNSDLSNILILY
jgi:type I restriction enzyme S subunit